MDEALKGAGLSSLDQLDYVVGTGYGRLKVPFANDNVSEITCHARGAHWMNPAVRTVVDIGGQDCKVMSVAEDGRVVEFAMNDRCAAGTGRFFEGMARVLGCGLEGISSLENQGDNPASISSQCSVFAESEVVTLINEGIELPDIVAGINNSVANRLYAMVRRVGLVKELVLTGGCSKNAGLAKALEKKLGITVTMLPEDPQLAGAVGAALIASEKATKS
jgi:predicted CoA-substrate-specific enzyme activase